MANFEEERLARMATNRQRMAEMGLLKQTTITGAFQQVKRPPVGPGATKIRKARKQRLDPRRSTRLSGQTPAYCEIDEHDRPIGIVHVPKEDANGDDGSQGLVDLMDRNGNHYTAEPSKEAFENLQEVRCSSQGRGSLYDKNVGITCHFCRQKKLCGEVDCPRCSTRDINQECIGKSTCSRCMSATGRFCRACLLIRYGQKLEDVQKETAEGTWLCPHCYEEEHPDEGWICNSSICMTRRGLKPTGIAIYDAQERGFKSVAHLLQDQLQKRGAAKVLAKAAGVQSDDDAGTPCDPKGNGSQDSDATVAQLDELDVPLATRRAALKKQAQNAPGTLAPTDKPPAKKARGTNQQDNAASVSTQVEAGQSTARRSSRLANA